MVFHHDSRKVTKTFITWYQLESWYQEVGCCCVGLTLLYCFFRKMWKTLELRNRKAFDVVSRAE